MKTNKKGTIYIVQAALIAAIYAALTYAISPIAFGANQVRISEALTMLPVLTPAAIPGLTIGCIIANIGSPFGIADIVIGSLATLFATICTRATRNIRFKNMPLLSLLFPVLFNGVFIGLEIAYFLPEGLTLGGFLVSGGSVALGEAISCYVLGLILFNVLNRVKIFK